MSPLCLHSLLILTRKYSKFRDLVKRTAVNQGDCVGIRNTKVSMNQCSRHYYIVKLQSQISRNTIFFEACNSYFSQINYGSTLKLEIPMFYLYDYLMSRLSCHIHTPLLYKFIHDLLKDMDLRIDRILLSIGYCKCQCNIIRKYELFNYSSVLPTL